MNYAPILIEIVDYVENNIHRVITLDEISSTFFVSKFHFHRIFKFYTGMTFTQYITKRRLQYIGNDILTLPSKEIWKIALDYSYTQPQTLNRIFKKHYNVTPTQYRKDNTKKIIQVKLVILKKDTISINGKMMANFSLDFWTKKTVYGEIYTIDLTEKNYTEEEIIAFKSEKSLNFPVSSEYDTIYAIFIEESKERSVFGVFTESKDNHKDSFVIPASLHAVLFYYGDQVNTYVGVIQNDIESIIIKKHINKKIDNFYAMRIYSRANKENYSIVVPVEMSNN